MAATKSKRRKPARQELKPGQCLCDFCTGLCCHYFSLPITNPTTWDEYDAIRWYLAHGRTVIYVEKGQWYLLVMSRCRYLTPENRCGIYLSRPKVCREYSTDNCEYDNGWSFEKIFETPEQVWEYAEAVLPPEAEAPRCCRGIVADRDRERFPIRELAGARVRWHVQDRGKF